MVSVRGYNREDYGKVIESGRMKQDTGGFNFHKVIKEYDAPSPVNISDQREENK